MKIVSSLILLLYLVVISFFIMVDAVATVTFRWREYGEVTKIFFISALLLLSLL